MPLWKPFRHRLEARACRLLAWAIPRLSRRRCVKLGWVLGDLAFRLDARGRAVAFANLECVFGDRYTAAQRARSRGLRIKTSPAPCSIFSGPSGSMRRRGASGCAPRASTS